MEELDIGLLSRYGIEVIDFFFLKAPMSHLMTPGPYLATWGAAAIAMDAKSSPATRKRR